MPFLVLLGVILGESMQSVREALRNRIETHPAARE